MVALLEKLCRQDYADSVDLRQGGSRRGERITHLPLIGFDVRVDATQIGEELLGQITATGLGGRCCPDPPQRCRRLVGGQSERGSAGVDARTTAAKL